jgi:hypothetical protein
MLCRGLDFFILIIKVYDLSFVEELVRFIPTLFFIGLNESQLIPNKGDILLILNSYTQILIFSFLL